MAGFLDPTLPLISLTSGTRAAQGVLDVAGPADIEDLPTPFFCISTNLTRAEEVIHRRGSLVVAARASGAVPGIFPPVPVGGDLLVDGGLCNNVPVDVMSALFGGVVIAVDVIPEVDLETAGEEKTSISGWDVAWRAVNPFAKSVAMPNIVNILMRSATAASVAFSKTGEKAKIASLYLRPSVTKWNILDFKSAGPIAEEGYRGSIKELEAFWTANRERIMGRQVQR
jgi:predicted acylesterase/phospholipase RssA